MPISRQWDQSSGIWTLTAGSTIDLDDLFRLLDRDDWRDATLFLWDLRALEEAPNAVEQLRQVLDLLARRIALRQARRVAIVAARDLEVGISRIFEAYAEIAGLETEFQIDLPRRPAACR